MLVTIASLQRPRAVQNNRLTACRREGQRFNRIHCHAEHTNDVYSKQQMLQAEAPRALLLVLLIICEVQSAAASA